MGNKLGRRKVVVEKYTKPQGLYQIHNVDLKKLRKLILECKIAPCYPGDEESGSDLEECPICFLYYPSLNRSRCCMKSICTECFLQMRSPYPARPTQCPFCKTPYYAVKYQGVKTKEEKEREQIEEQRVIEAKIRMGQREIVDKDERINRQQPSSSNQAGEAVDSDGGSVAVLSSQPPGEAEEIISLPNSLAAPIIRNPRNTELKGNDVFDLDLEEKMVAEAMRQSMQEKEKWRNQNSGDVSPHNQFVDLASGDQSVNGYISATSLASSSQSFSEGLAHAITAAIAEHQQNNIESSARQHWCSPSFSVLPGCSMFRNTVEQETKYYPPTDSAADVSSDNRMVMAIDGDWNAGNNSEGLEAGTSYASHHVIEDAAETEYKFPSVPELLVPQSFEEQMMLAMAVSLTEGQAVPSMAGVTWQ